MLRKILVGLGAMMAALPLLAASGIDSPVDPGVRAQDDFYRYVNDAWLAKHPIPADKSAWGNPHVVDEITRAHVKEIVEGALKDTTSPPGSDARRIGDLYSSYIDEARVESLGLAPLKAEFARV